jgi:hypothetical protein
MKASWTQHRRGAIAVAGMMVALLVIGACSSGGAKTANSAAGPVAGAASAVERVPANAKLAPYAQAPAAGSVPLAATAHGTVASGSGTSGSGTASGGSLGLKADQLLPSDRSLIKTAQITVQEKKATDVAPAADRAEALVTALGGEVFADNRTSGAEAEASLNLRVPPVDLAQVLTSLSALGTELSRTESTQDVTTKVADVGARLKSAQDSINRLRQLFSVATKIGDIISLEDELSNREAELESLQAQQKALSSETAMANVTLTLTTAPVPVKKAAVVVHHKKNRLQTALTSGWRHFTGGAAWLVGALVTLLPFLILLVVALSLWVALGRARQQRRSGTDRSPATS